MKIQTLSIASLALCNLSAWYVLLTKYLELKHMVKDFSKNIPTHIPGMGPPPPSDIPFTMPEGLVIDEPRTARREPYVSAETPQQPHIRGDVHGRLACNFACILHVSGFALITGIPFLNILVPTILWLWKKEEHVFLDKQGRAVINFQITFTVVQFLVLGLGALCIYLMPNLTARLFSATKVVSIVFSSSMYIPFNIFTLVPFFWGCISMLRGAVAAYNGIDYKYPSAQEFIFANNVTLQSPPQRPHSSSNLNTASVKQAQHTKSSSIKFG